MKFSLHNNDLYLNSTLFEISALKLHIKTYYTAKARYAQKQQDIPVHKKNFFIRNIKRTLRKICTFQKEKSFYPPSINCSNKALVEDLSELRNPISSYQKTFDIKTPEHYLRCGVI